MSIHTILTAKNTVKIALFRVPKQSKSEFFRPQKKPKTAKIGQNLGFGGF